MSEKLLYYVAGTTGGMADYAREQTKALAAEGTKLAVLCTPEWPSKDQRPYEILPLLSSAKESRKVGCWQSRVKLAIKILKDHSKLADAVEAKGIRRVLCVAYSEYLAPLWSGRLRRLARQGVVFGSIVHDPVRDYVVGPLWWHRRSVAAGYSYLREVFVHEPVNLDFMSKRLNPRTTVVPIGTFPFPAPSFSGAEARGRLGLPVHSKVLLSFGYVRDSKNLDLVLQAMTVSPQLYLVVAGKVSNGDQRSPEFYQALAKRLGVAERCRWVNRFIPDNEIGNLFVASNLVVLTYSKSFRSASAVLNTAIYYRKPVIASGGQGSLCSAVKKYRLGILVEPDDLSSLKSGLVRWQTDLLSPLWDAYDQDNSWQLNAKRVIGQLDLAHAGRGVQGAIVG